MDIVSNNNYKTRQLISYKTNPCRIAFKGMTVKPNSNDVKKLSNHLNAIPLKIKYLNSVQKIKNLFNPIFIRLKYKYQDIVEKLNTFFNPFLKRPRRIYQEALASIKTFFKPPTIDNSLEHINSKFWEFKAVLQGKKPAALLDKKVPKKIINTILEQANVLEEKSGGNLKILKTSRIYPGKNGNPFIYVFNIPKLKQTVQSNRAFYHEYFPNAKSVDEIVKELTGPESPLIKEPGDLSGVTIGFPLGDALVCSQDLKPDVALKLLKDNPDWEIHRKILQGKLDEMSCRKEGDGFWTWNPDGADYKKYCQNISSCDKKILNNASEIWNQITSMASK